MGWEVCSGKPLAQESGILNCSCEVAEIKVIIHVVHNSDIFLNLPVALGVFIRITAGK